MKLYKYNSYEDYKHEQIKANKRKINNSYVDPISLRSVLQLLRDLYNHTPSSVLCHGTRKGDEQKIFIDFYKEYEESPTVIGTEISPTATDYPNTIQWDFHEVKPEWKANIDLIYSNSFDHSYQPRVCLDAWMSCLSPKGICIIEYSEDCDTISSPTDPFAASLEEMKDLITTRYKVLDVVSTKGLEDQGKTHKGVRYYILIQNK